MKKMNALLAAGMILTLGAGCSDATAKLSDAKTAVMTVGNKTITKGDMYSFMVGANGASSVVTNAKAKIAEKEIEITDKMKEDAQSTMDLYTTYYGDYFDDYLASLGIEADEYIDKYLLPSARAERLTYKYVEENFEELTNRYMPIKATILAFSDEEKADEALEALKEDTEISEVITTYESTSKGEPAVYHAESSLDSAVAAVIGSYLPEDGWQKVAESTGSVYDLIRIEETDFAAFKDEIVETLGALSSLSDPSDIYWFTKYGFHIYDKPLYDMIKESNPSLIIQDN